MTSAWAYLAVSSDAQADTLESQHAWARGVAAERGWTLARVFQGVATGKRGPRSIFLEMVAELRRLSPAARPAWLLMVRADRIGRGRIADSQVLLHEIADLGVRIWTRDGGEFKIDSATDQIIAAVKAGMAALENEVKRDRLLAGHARRRALGQFSGSNPPFGLKRDAHGRLAPSDEAWIVERVEAMYLAGDKLMDILAWVRTVAPGAWGSHAGLMVAFHNEAYVTAGLRTRERHEALRALAAERQVRKGIRRKHDHELAAVFACGACLALGVDETDALMGEQWAGMTPTGPEDDVVCQSTRSAKRRHPRVAFRVRRIAPAWRAIIAEISTSDAALATWEAGGSAGGIARRKRQLQRALSRLDQDEAALATRRGRALDLTGDPEPEIAQQARRALIEIGRDEAEFAARRDVIQGELAAIDDRRRNVAALRDTIKRYRQTYERATIVQRNMLNRALCAAVGSHPILERVGDRRRWSMVVVRWPALGIRVELPPKPVGASAADPPNVEVYASSDGMAV